LRVLETGNHLVALAANAAGVEVVPAYPITPQTQVIEKVADLIAEGKMDAEYIPVESEHSACAALVSASMTGVRAFSATSAHGLAYMHEMLHYAAGIRAPAVMANINRALGPGWNIWCDHQDAISQRDTGWLQVFVAGHQEAVDTLIQAYRITENRSVMLPLMMNLAAFVLSHTYMDAEVPSRGEVEKYLPPFSPMWRLDPRLPVTHGSVIYPSDFSETRESMAEGQINAREVIRDAAREYREMFGRWHGDMVDGYLLEDAEHLVVAMGSVAAEAKVAVDRLRDGGHSVGLLRIRFFRPFPVEEIVEVCGGREDVVVLDRDYSYGIGGALYTEIKSVLYNRTEIPVYDVIMGLGGRDVTFERIAETAEAAWRGELSDITWADSHITDSHRVTFEMLDNFRSILD
jgi:pyruvate ferredoxin oxidoreductase alpha subunit